VRSIVSSISARTSSASSSGEYQTITSIRASSGITKGTRPLRGAATDDARQNRKMPGFEQRVRLREPPIALQPRQRLVEQHDLVHGADPDRLAARFQRRASHGGVCRETLHRGR